MSSSQASSPGPLPDAKGHFGPYGGRFVPENLMPALEELAAAYATALEDPSFSAELAGLLEHYAGRPTPLYEAANLSRALGGGRIFLKREDLTHTGAHKINNALGQVLLARRMGKKRIIAETGAGQHGVATATTAALMGLECLVYMGTLDMERQALNVTRMEMLGAKVEPVTSGSCSLKDATTQAIRDWVSNVRDTHYIIGSVVGPHPYPRLVRDFQAVIGREARAQLLEREGRLPNAAVACVGAGSNAIGLFHPLLDDPVDLIGVEAAGYGLDSGEHSASLTAGKPGVLHGAALYLLQDPHGQIIEAYSMAAGLDYPGVGPEHSHLKDIERVTYATVDDKAAVRAFMDLTRLEGIIPALESAHALAHLKELAPQYGKDDIILVCLSGRGDKDVSQVTAYLEKQK
ncbi:MAG: tryptophan synthase subunit beta [Desulfarculaceae bacterium]|nr:tryptophan synthase subunit beta [Desulfarculaceae bacterium]MCF8071665.1 tryptophan synthase subunit beta [Desulfarculaceae bacterium]MCF8102488.1 tryptophan synthase subunit beta [Desulfarculaceae bacterium]MCF8114944.1 tryptophan synthase subunit beta [Desulfarculaceae bacterium]